MKLSFKTPAKINLGLKIHRKREDGYHELETILQMVSLYDEIELETLPGGIELECDAPGIPQDETNLVVQAAKRLRRHFPGDWPGARIGLKKNIPSGAGLGGGSGNAAGVLMGLNVLWDMKLARKSLVPLAAELGADVPFFLTAPCALGKGRGDDLTAVKPAERFWVMLIYPMFPIATAWVYRNLKLKLTKGENNISILQKFLSESKISGLGTHLCNDLEPVVIQEYSEIQAIKDQLISLGAKGALLSGSGSTVFGIFTTLEQAEGAYAKLNKGNARVFLTETVADFDQFWPDSMLNYP